MKISLIAVLLLLAPNVCSAQARHPHVDEIVKQHDADGDSLLSKSEVSESKRYTEQFSKWDADKDGNVSANEITNYRARFGIAADGSALSRSTFAIPDIDEFARVDPDNRPTRQQASNSAFVLATQTHAVAGTSYLVLTDHSDDAHLKALKRLIKHRKGELLVVENLSQISNDPALRGNIAKQLQDKNAKYVAVAPRVDSFSENLVLGIWAMLTSLDDDRELDCYPGFLVASNADAFSRLIDQSIAHEAIGVDELKPFAISQVQNSRETRSLQKSGVLRKHFQKSEIKTPIVAIYGETADQAPRLPGEQVWNMKVAGRKQFVKTFPTAAQQALDSANLIVMHGHGIPGMSCSVDVEGLPSDCSGKILMSGSCFAACPTKSDLPSMGRAPGGYEIEQRDSFVLRAIDNGAVAAFGHQRLSSGFPHLYPVLESWTQGETIGQSYQELINALISKSNLSPESFVLTDQQKQNKRVRQNILLYVVIGDPALTLFQSQPSPK